MTALVPGSLALVTGASSGIGRATCQVLAREGATVVVTCVDEPGAQETLASLTGSNHSVFKFDVSDFSSAQQIVKAIIAKYKRPPNILINCAGICPFKTLVEETPEHFQRVLDINLKGTVFACQAVCRELIAAKLPGAVIIVPSLTGHRGYEGMTAYACSKSALESVTRCMAKEMGPHNIRVNGVYPGFIKTQMSDGCPPEMVEAWLAQLATKRKGQPIEVAEMIVFLASDRCSYVNGAHVPVSGGF